MNGFTRRRKRIFFGGWVLACLLSALVLASGVSAAGGSTEVTQYSFTTPPHFTCGIWGTAVIHGTLVFRDRGNGTYFMSGTRFAVFTAADTGRSTTLSIAGPVTQASPPVIDAQAGTATITTTAGGLYERLSITHGPTLSRDAGSVTFVDVYGYTGDPTDPVDFNDFRSETLSGLDGPHPDLLSGFSIFCDVIVPYLQGP